MQADLAPVGFLITGDGDRPGLVLPRDHPLSYTRLAGTRESLARTLAQSRAAALRRRVPVALEDPESAAADLRRTTASSVFPVFGEGVAFLDLAQLRAVAGAGGLRSRTGAVRVAQLALEPVWELAEGGEEPHEEMQYWNSHWRFAEGEFADPDAGWWRVWPQKERESIRSDFVASLGRGGYEALGRPEYVVLESPFFPGRYVAAFVRLDDGITETTEDVDGRPLSGNLVVALDGSCRDAIGVLDGEFAVVHPWRRGHGRRSTVRRFVGARSVMAHVKSAARADMDKPVCRLSVEALDAIGVRPGDMVVVEAVGPEEESGNDWRAQSRRIRALAIDEREAENRASWEQAGGNEGFVDCAEALAIHPPYPDIYMDYFVRQQLGVGLCGAVRVRAGIVHRLLSDAGDFVWLAVGGLLVAFLTQTNLPTWIVIGVPLLLVIGLLFLRVRRAIR